MRACSWTSGVGLPSCRRPPFSEVPRARSSIVVKADQTVTVRPVTVGEIQGGEASIKTGLSPGELVVVDGAERLREGTRVELKTSKAARQPTQKGY